eukprot:483326-Pyramimonas_sp.AAC.1
MHLYSYPSKERVSNQQAYLERIGKRFEAAQEAERQAELALSAAQKHREAMPLELNQASSLLDSFKVLAEQESPNKTVTFEETPTPVSATAPTPQPPSPFVPTVPVPPQVIADLQANQNAMTSALTALQGSI